MEFELVFPNAEFPLPELLPNDPVPPEELLPNELLLPNDPVLPDELLLPNELLPVLLWARAGAAASSKPTHATPRAPDRGYHLRMIAPLFVR
jgi:hypothetical protein